MGKMTTISKSDWLACGQKTRYGVPMINFLVRSSTDVDDNASANYYGQFMIA